MNFILFSRFKKKTIRLAYGITPEEFIEVLKEIKNKKLRQCAIKDKLLNNKLVLKSEWIEFLLKLSNTKIVIIDRYSLDIEVWDLLTLKSINTIKLIEYDIISCLAKLSEAFIATGGSEIKIWNVNSSTYFKTLKTGKVTYIVKLK